jgi:cold shock CspA family protein
VANGSRRPRFGVVTQFDPGRGSGVVVSREGTEFAFHATAIGDGSRKILPGTVVSFTVAAAVGGRFEVLVLMPLEADKATSG